MKAVAAEKRGITIPSAPDRRPPPAHRFCPSMRPLEQAAVQKRLPGAAAEPGEGERSHAKNEHAQTMFEVDVRGALLEAWNIGWQLAGGGQPVKGGQGDE